MRILRVILLLCASGAMLHGQAIVLPAATGEGVNRGQPFDRKVPDASVYAGRVFFVWGAQQPKSVAPTVNSKYLPYSRDPDRSHNLDWYKKNHPEWVEYLADRTTPAYGYIYARGNAMSIDITNPAVREWYWKTYIQPHIDAGYPMFAFDNVDLQNGEKRVGHYDASGRWVGQFSGEKMDDAYALAVLEWMQYLCTRLHKVGIGVAANITFPLGKPQLEPAMRKLVEMVDVWGDEQGFTQHNDAEINDERWQRKFDFVRSIEMQRIHWAVNETTGKSLAEASQTQIDWAVANYYLYREKNSLLTISGAQEYGSYLDTQAMQVDMGKPLAAPVHESGGAWTRNYSKGFVGVNPSSKYAVTMKLPPGTWVDSHGTEHVLKMELGAVNGVMLVKK